ncbi:MAG: SLOG family protein [Faecousia sp.]
MERKTCCFIAQRTQSLPYGFYEKDERCTILKQVLRKQILRLIEKENVTHFISGMAIGVDMYAAEIVLDTKKHDPRVTLEIAIPYETQAVKWSEALRERYFHIAAQCDKETMLQTHYTPDCMGKRNRYLVDHSDLVIAVWSGKSSGRGKTIRYSLSQGKPVIVIDPVTFEITEKRQA